jgi:microtubule-associated protein-like 6
MMEKRKEDMEAADPETDYKPPGFSADAPDESLELQWVHGYRAHDARNNLHYTSTGDIVYTAAGVGIIYNKNSHTQNHHIEHTDDIICCAVSPDGTKVATGQMGKSPSVIVWDAGSCATLAVLKGFHKKGVCQVAWSEDGTKIASVGQDDDHSIAVYDWEQERKIGSCKADQNKVLDIKFAPGPAPGTQNLVTCGEKHVKFWTMKGRNLKVKKGIFGKMGKIQTNLSIGFAGGKTVTGTASGDLYVWEGRTVVQVIAAHGSSVNALSSCANGIASGGKDGKIKLWTPELRLKCTFEVGVSRNSSIRSICWNPDNGKVLVGTRASEIYEYNDSDGFCQRGAPLAQAHYDGELWGLATKPYDGTRFVTCADDNTLRLWDTDKFKMLKACDLGAAARAITYSPDGKAIVAGLETGGLAIYEAGSLREVMTKSVSKEGVSDLKFSPDGETLAVASRDNRIYLYDVSSKYRRFAICKGHTACITHIDFSSDGQFLQSTSPEGELFFWKVEDGKQVKNAADFWNTDWASFTGTLGWQVQGIWPAVADGTEPNAVCRSNSSKLLGYADDFGKVKVYRYPCIGRTDAEKQSPSDAKSYDGHSSHVTNARFSHNDRHLMTVGGNDKSIFQWQLK